MEMLRAAKEASMDAKAAYTPGRSHALDGLRGYAACAVAFYHAILMCDPSLTTRVVYPTIQTAETLRDVLTKIVLTILNGENAVFLFFILSGCVLRLSLDRRAKLQPIPLIAGFAFNRVIRLYPPLIATLAGMYVLGRAGLPPAEFTLHQFALNSSLFQITMHGASHTIRVEVLAIPFLLVAWFLRRHLGLLGLILASAYAVMAYLDPRLALGIASMEIYLLAFILGMLAAEPSLRQIFGGEKTFAPWIALGVLTIGRALFIQSPQSFIMLSMLGAALVALLLHGPRGSLHRLLENRFSQHLGKLSYSLYLLSVPALFAFIPISAQPWARAHALEAGLGIGLLSLILAWPFAWALERWVEVPSIKLGRKVAEIVAVLTTVQNLPARAVPEDTGRT
jgi:peptidoglycan/LPS O-acetylase OafA/YrhL